MNKPNNSIATLPWVQLADQSSIERVIASFKKNNMEVFLMESSVEARKKALKMIPLHEEVMTMTSVTLDTLGISHEIQNSGKYDSVRNKLNAMDRKTQFAEMLKLGTAPKWVIGSVHAVTEEGHALIASNTGSQLGAYAYGSMHVIWIVGTQKIVKNREEGIKRIYEYCLPLESERARKAYGSQGSSVNKLLIVNNEVTKGRITMLLVNEVLGY